MATPDSKLASTLKPPTSLQQVQHLRTHPVVAAKLANGKIEIHGWVYDIKSGNIRCCGRDSMEFMGFDQYYSDYIAKIGE